MGSLVPVAKGGTLIRGNDIARRCVLSVEVMAEIRARIANGEKPHRLAREFALSETTPGRKPHNG